MKSGLRGGKPRDMATMSHGGMTSRGAGAAQRGYDYDVYRKGGKVKKYAEGGKTVKEYGMSRGTESMPEWDVPQYSFSDLFGKKKKAQETKPTAVEKPALETPKSDDRGETYGGVPVFQGVEPEPSPARAPRRSSGPSVQRRRMELRRSVSEAADQPPGGSAAPISPDVSQPPGGSAGSGRRRRQEPEVMRNLRRAVHGADYARELESRYAKGGGVKMAGGGTCRGMGAATKGGKYTIK